MAYKAQVHKTVSERLWEKVNRNGPIPPHQPHLGPCWLWMAYLDVKGYGRLSVATYPNGVYKAKLAYSHILVWEEVKGAVPTGLCVLHKCDNPACVRPDHLFLGTRKDNNKDRHAKGRYDTCPKGEDNYKHKLTSDQVLEIRRICQPAKPGNTHMGAPKNSYTDLARWYGVNYGTIRLIVLRKNWKHI